MPGRNQIARAEVNGNGDGAKVLNSVTERKKKTYSRRGISVPKVAAVSEAFRKERKKERREGRKKRKKGRKEERKKERKNERKKRKKERKKKGRKKGRKKRKEGRKKRKKELCSLALTRML
jgi:hypothetical protein